MATFLDKTKNMLKQVHQMQKDLKEGTKLDKLTFPEGDTKEEDPHPSEIQTVHISAKSVAKSTLVILGILALTYFIYEIKSLLILFFISLFFASALGPSVDWMEKRRIPRSVSVILILLLFFSIFVVIIGSAVPIIIDQITLIATKMALYVRELFTNIQSDNGLEFIPETIRPYVLNGIKSINIESAFSKMIENFYNFAEQIKDLASSVGSTVGVVGAGVTSFTITVAEFFFNLVLVLFLVFFMVVDKNNLHDFFQSLFPKRYSSFISTRIKDIQDQIGAWLRGMFLLSFIMFALTFIGLNIIGMGEYALTLALIMGIGEMIPYIGPIIFLVFSLPIAFGTSWLVVVNLLIFYSIIQTVEGNILVPAVMKRIVGLSPIIVIMVLIIGWHFLGIVGAVIAVPITTAVAMFVRDYIQMMKQK